MKFTLYAVLTLSFFAQHGHTQTLQDATNKFAKNYYAASFKALGDVSAKTGEAILANGNMLLALALDPSVTAGIASPNFNDKKQLTDLVDRVNNTLSGGFGTIGAGNQALGNLLSGVGQLINGINNVSDGSIAAVRELESAKKSFFSSDMNRKLLIQGMILAIWTENGVLGEATAAQLRSTDFYAYSDGGWLGFEKLKTATGAETTYVRDLAKTEPVQLALPVEQRRPDPQAAVSANGQPVVINSKFNGAYSTPYGSGVSTVRYRDLKFGSDGTTANFTAVNAQGQASSAVRNGAGVVGHGQANASGVNFNWGRWAENQGTQLNTSSAGSFVGVPVHYIYADFPRAGIVYPASGAFTFNLVGGTAPTSSVGTSGVLNSMQVGVDFGARQFQVLNMGVSFAGRNMNLSSTLQPFGQGANASELSSNSTNFIAGNLTGTCTGAACGSNTVGFINGRFAGPNANGIAAGYSVRNSGGSATTINIGGVAGLAR